MRAGVALRARAIYIYALCYSQPWQQGGRGVRLTKWRTIGNQL